MKFLRYILIAIILSAFIPLVSVGQSQSTTQATVAGVSETITVFSGVANDILTATAGVYSATWTPGNLGHTFNNVMPINKIICKVINSTTSTYTANGGEGLIKGETNTGTLRVEIYGGVSIQQATATYNRLGVISTFKPTEIDVSGFNALYARLIGSTTDFDVTVYSRPDDN